jgi:ABC-type microcin C transport system duplicated ATPase subunit YejF
VEQGETKDVFFDPQEEYTRKLINETVKIMGEKS